MRTGAGVGIGTGIRLQRRWFKPWKVEYSWQSTAYGAVVGYTWTKTAALRRCLIAVTELMFVLEDDE